MDYEGVGAVVAAPDDSTPGGSYVYHWMRDAGLSIKAWMDINDNDYSRVKEVLEKYTDWVGIVQHKPDQNNDVRIEPKFEIPSGDPYTGTELFHVKILDDIHSMKTLKFKIKL